MSWMIGADVQRQRQRSAFVRQLFDLGLLSASPIQCIFSPTVAAYLLCISWLSACEIPQTSPKHQTPVVTVNVLHAWWHYSHQCKDECKDNAKTNAIIMQWQYKYQTSPKHQTPVLTVKYFTCLMTLFSSMQRRMQRRCKDECKDNAKTNAKTMQRQYNNNAIQIQNIAKTQKTPVVINVFHTWLAQFLSMRAKKSGAYKICELGEMILLIDIHPHSWFCAGAGL